MNHGIIGRRDGEPTADGADEWGMKRWSRILLSAGKRWNADNVFKHSAAVSFYMLFSLAPITIIAIGVASLVFGKDFAAQQLAAQLSQLVGKESADVIRKAMEANAVHTRGWVATAIGLGVMVVGATTVFAQLQDSLNSIWSVTAKPSRSGWVVMIVQRLISFAMVLTMGFLLLASMVLTTALTAVVTTFSNHAQLPPWVLRTTDLGVGLVVITVLFALLFKVLPDVRLRWRNVWIGALVTAVLFTIGRFLIALYLGHTTTASSYGAAGSLVALLIWIYYSAAILFFGAEFIRAYDQEHGLPVEPKDTAARVRREVIEQAEPPPKHGPNRSRQAES